jgi:hypothetical protein
VIDGNNRPIGPGTLVATILLGLTILVNALLFVVSLLPNEGSLTDRAAPALFAGPAVAGAVAAVLLWHRVLRRRGTPLLAAAVLLAFLGICTLSLGLFVLLTPEDDNLLRNAGFSVALCFTPGLLLTIAGLGMYWYDGFQGSAASGSPIALRAVERRMTYAQMTRRAAEYRRRLETKLAVLDPMPDSLRNVPELLQTWESLVERIGAAIAAYDSDRAVRSDLAKMPDQLRRVTGQLSTARDAATRAHLEAVQQELQARVDNLSGLALTVSRARSEVEESISAFGRVYSQVRSMGTVDWNSPDSYQIAGNLTGQIESLNDRLSATAELVERSGPSTKNSSEDNYA